MTDWKSIDSAPKDGTWVLMKGGRIDYGWDADTQPSCVTAQWRLHTPWNKNSGWHFASYDSGYYGEYENPTHWAEMPL